MAIEKKWPAVAPRLFSADGSAQGLITLNSTSGFKVKQKVVVKSNTQPNLQVQVKRVTKTNIIVGPVPTKQGELNKRQDISAYLVADSAYIFAEEQDKANLKPDDIVQAVYDQEPTTAIRTVFVDENGDYYDANNPLPVAVDVSIPTVIVRRLTDKPNDGTPDNLPDAVQIGNGINRLKVNADGSINTVTGATGVTTVVIPVYNEVTSVAGGIITTIATYIAPPGLTNAFLQRVSVSGDNVARYDVYINSDVIGTARTSFTELNSILEFKSFDNTGVNLNSGDTVTVKVIHNRPSLSSFNTTIQIAETT